MINKWIGIGNLTKDVEVRYSQGGAAVANFTVATNETWIKDGKKEEKTEFHKIVAFGRLGEICGEYLTKGSKVYIEGRIQNRSYEDKDGIKRGVSEIVAREMKILTPKANTGGRASDEPPMPEPTSGGDSEIPF